MPNIHHPPRGIHTTNAHLQQLHVVVQGPAGVARLVAQVAQVVAVAENLPLRAGRQTSGRHGGRGQMSQ
jgi:hypothetical protein